MQNADAITLQWTPPLNDGGCRITSYVVLRKDGLGGDLMVEANVANDPQVRDQLSRNVFTITNFPPISADNTIKFQIRVITTQRTDLSAVNFITPTSAPLKPTKLSISDPFSTIIVVVKVSLGSPNNGGSSIISYELAMDDGKSGD